MRSTGSAMRRMLGCSALGLALAAGGTGCGDSESPQEQAPAESPQSQDPTEMPEERAPSPEQSPPEAAPSDGDGAAPAGDAPAGADAGATEVDWSGGDSGAGKEAYALYCQTCHGETGTGDGPGAAALDPKPRDFTTGDFAFDPNSDGETGDPADLALVVQNGAAAYGGSANMVPWGGVLSEQQIRDVVAYVRELTEGSQ